MPVNPMDLQEGVQLAQRMLAARPGAASVRACYIGEDAAQHLARFAREHCGATCFAISDENTRMAAGEALFSALGSKGVSITEHVFGAHPLDATRWLSEEVAEMGNNAEFYLAAGSGTLSDLAKFAGSLQDKPVILYPTAASMNGYTSSIAALKVNGLKRTLPCNPALGVFADPEVIASAPKRMTAAGVGDFLSKASAATDWRIAWMLRNESYDENAMAFYRGAQESVLAAAPKVGQDDPEAVAMVLKSLLLSGLAMLVAGSSAPASGGEHLISHYLDMKSALFGNPHDLHGLQVGVATIDCLRLWERIMALDTGTIDPPALAQAHPSGTEIRQWIEEDWGPIAGEVWEQWKQKALNSTGIQQEIEHFKTHRDQHQEQFLQDFCPAHTVEKAIEAAGGCTRPEQLDAPFEAYEDAFARARFIRSRFTVLDLAAELGLR